MNITFRVLIKCIQHKYHHERSPQRVICFISSRLDFLPVHPRAMFVIHRSLSEVVTYSNLNQSLVPCPCMIS